MLGKCSINHSSVGQSSQKPKSIEGHKNSLGLVIYQKYVTACSSFGGNCVTNTCTHGRTHTHGANYNLLPACQAGDNNRVLKPVKTLLV